MSETTFLEQFSSQFCWQTAPAKRRFRYQKDVNRGMRETHRLALTMRGVIDRSLNDLEGLQASDYTTYQVFEQGDLVFKLIDLENIKTSRVGLVPRRGIMSPAYIRLVPDNRDANSRFYAWFFFAAYFNNIFNGMGGGVRQNLTPTDLLEFPIPLPDLSTQREIADFLDRETARIDLLIQKREKFAVLVAEARDSLLAKMICGEGSETLDATRNEWTDARPANWKSERAKVHFRERIEKSVDGSEELLTVSHITGVTTRAEKDVNMFLAESNEGYKIVHHGDIVINTMWGWMGAMGVSSHYGIISPSYGIYRPTSDAFECEYLDLMLRSKPFVVEVTRRSKGIHSSRLRIYPDAFLDMRLPIPPRDKQVAILAELRRRIEHENALLAKNEQASALLKEYRSALITAAVTGQIDVTTYAKSGTTDRRLDAIQEEMGA